MNWEQLVTRLRKEFPGHADALIAFLLKADTATRMVALNDHRIPPVAEVGRYLATLGARPADSAKTTMGKLVKEVMSKHGYVPVRPARVPPPSYFATGSIYAPEPAA